MLFLIPQLQDSSCRKTAPAACSAPTLPTLAPGAGGAGADGGESAVAAGLRSPTDPCGSPQALPAPVLVPQELAGVGGWMEFGMVCQSRLHWGMSQQVK